MSEGLYVSVGRGMSSNLRSRSRDNMELVDWIWGFEIACAIAPGYAQVQSHGVA